MKQNNQIRELLTKAFWFSKQAYGRCYDSIDPEIPADYTEALALAAKCTSYYAAAAAAYFSDPDHEDDNVIDILKQFEIVTNEIRTVYGQRQKNLVGLHVEIDCLERMLSENGCET